MSAEVPEALEGRVHYDGDALVLRDSAWRPLSVMAVGAIAAGAALSFAGGCALLAFLGLVGDSGAVFGVGMVGAMGFVVAAGAAFALPTVHTLMPVPLRVDDLGIWIQHPLGKKVGKPSEVQVYGAVGTRITVCVVGDDGTLVPVSAVPSVSGYGWTLDALLWFADAMAARLGVPVRNTIDRAAWTRWELDPAFRRRIHFERDDAANRRRFAEAHAVTAPVAPEDVVYDHHGMRIGRGLLVEAGEVRVPAGRIPLSSIVDVVPRVQEVPTDDGGVARRVVLRVLTNDRILSLRARKLTARSMRETLWIANELKRLAAEGSPEPDPGTRSDVPEALVRLQGSAKGGE